MFLFTGASLLQLWGTSLVRPDNITSNVMVGPITITVPIVDANSNVSRECDIHPSVSQCW